MTLDVKSWWFKFLIKCEYQHLIIFYVYIRLWTKYHITLSLSLSLKCYYITDEIFENRLTYCVIHAGNQVKCSKNRVDALDLENFSYKYSLIEGDVLMDKLEKISYDVKFEPTADGGSKNTMTSTYYTKGNIVLTEEEIKEGKEKSLAMYKVVENYLMQNPEEYASLEFSSLIKNKYIYKNALR